MKKMTFLRIFQETDVARCLKPGIQAMGRYSSLIETHTPADFEGSVDIDTCLKSLCPQDNRWDYAFGYHQCIYYVEVHHASDSEVNVVLKKFKWLKDWQNRQTNPALLKNITKYYWISSGKVTITKNSRFARILAQSGLEYPKKSLRV